MTRVRLALLVLLAGACFLGSVLVIVSLRGGGEPLGVAAGYDRRVERLLVPRRPTAAALAQAETLAHAALRQYPEDTGAWLNLAYIDTARAGRLTPRAQGYLARSYDLIAVDPTMGVWRARFALSHSQELPKELKNSVKAEVQTLAMSPRRKSQLKQMAGAIPDQIGATWLTLWLIQAEHPVAR